MRDRVIATKYRRFGVVGPRMSSFTLGWLATHRGRLHTLMLGGKRLSLLVIWDSKGAAPVERSVEEEDALRLVCFGPVAPPERVARRFGGTE